jgi:hypothetical protein
MREHVEHLAIVELVLERLPARSPRCSAAGEVALVGDLPGDVERRAQVARSVDAGVDAGMAVAIVWLTRSTFEQPLARRSAMSAVMSRSIEPPLSSNWSLSRWRMAASSAPALISADRRRGGFSV